MAQTRTLGQITADWLAVRRPTRLVVDGWILLAMSAAIYVLWSEWAGVSWAERPSPSGVERAIGYAFSGSHLAAYYMGLTLVAVGCARLIADALRDRKEVNPVKPSETP